ncbi:MAG: hypothetical protein Q7S74_06400 [Nanoarchaeota archaeon]|nr:hypothetical protein [Nanoarchaeota archaeon]
MLFPIIGSFEQGRGPSVAIYSIKGGTVFYSYHLPHNDSDNLGLPRAKNHNLLEITHGERAGLLAIVDELKLPVTEKLLKYLNLDAVR